MIIECVCLDLSLNNKAIIQDSSFFYHDYPVFYAVQRVVGIFKVWPSNDSYIITNATVFVYDSIFNITTLADANLWNALLHAFFHYFQCFVEIITHNVRAYYRSAIANTGADTHHTML